MRRLIIPAAILIIIAVVVTIALSNTVSDKTLTAQEQNLIAQACASCHDDIELADVSLHSIHEGTSCFSCHESLHPIHTNAECQDCHAGTTGLKTADQAHNVLKWVGIGGAGILLVSLAVNLFVARRRLGTRGESNGEKDDKTLR